MTDISTQAIDDGKGSFSDEFYLEDGSPFRISGTPNGVMFPRWMQVAHCIDKRQSLILLAGEELVITKSIKVKKDTKLYVRYGAGIPKISSDGLVLEVSFSERLEKRKDVEMIASFSISGGQQTSQWREAHLDVSFLMGRQGYFIFKCLPGPKNDPIGDWLAIAELCVARVERLSLMKARTFHEQRSRNEIDHFSHVYRHTMYSQMQDERSNIAQGQARPVRKLHCSEINAVPYQIDRLNHIGPLSHESPYAYGSRLLAANITESAPDFVGRLKLKADNGKPLKVLSLCSGAARIEADFASHVGNNVEWSLLDINPDLLCMASKQFAPTVSLDLIEADANDLQYSGEKWDIIICVSALHHIVELEKLIEFCHKSLNDDGEFWSIGEYVGRNGNRLWPEALDVANGIFKELPEKFRLNRNTGTVDTEIPDNDYSVGCFEGIRSEDIEPTLERWFKPLDVFRRNCFLWRLLNLAYNDNYNAQNLDDRQLIVRMVEAELDHFKNGGRGTELFGVYKPR
ncbi:MAG: class I SAM-dependent methyltransferase [Methanomassiliicoccales archaeon]|nr:class I SAM-dependent methyltransferase [Methanomassiliicoccales archaeon]